MKIILILFVALSLMAHAKRLAPADIQPLPVKKGTVHQSFERSAKGFSVYLVKKDLSGQVLWKTKLYSKIYIPNLESDVQDIWLRKLTVSQEGILAVDEYNRSYQVDPSDGALMKPAAPVTY